MGRYRFFILAAVVLAVGSIIGYTDFSFTLIPFGSFLAFGCAIATALVALLFAILKRWRAFAGWATLCFASLTGFIIGPMVMASQELKSMARGNEIVEHLQQHYAEHGRYPKSLSQIYPGADTELPKTGMGLVFPRHYFYRNNGSDFVLEFKVLAFGVCFRSSNVEWRCNR